MSVCAMVSTFYVFVGDTSAVLQFFTPVVDECSRCGCDCRPAIWFDAAETESIARFAH
jgi:hypothetical protein